MKLGSKTLAVLLLLVGLVLVNYLASSVPARLDLTAESIYSLSPGTKAMLGKIEESITLELYFSENATGLPIAYKNYATRVQEMLRQYVRSGGGKLTLSVINPRPDTPEEERATAAGLTPQIAQTGGEQFFFGLVVTQADQQKNIPAFTPQREQFLEYDLSKLIYSVQQFDKPKLGLLTSLPLQGSSPQEMQMMMMTGRQPQPSQFIIEEWRQSFDIVPVEPTAAELPADLDALAVVHPQNLSSALQFAVDQFLLNGSPVFLCVDPSSEYFKRQGGRQAMMMGGPQPNVSSDLPTLLSAWGLTYNSQNVVGDLENATQVQAQPGTLVRYPIWPSLRTENFNSTSLPTAQLNSMLFIEPGSVSLNSGTSLTFTPLIESSMQSGDVPVSSLQFAQPDDVSRQLTVSGKKTIAALVTGKFKTAFPNGAPKEEPKPDEQKNDDAQKNSDTNDAKAQPSADTPHLSESKSTSTLLFVADTDWLFDDYSVRKFNFFGQTAAEPFNDNLAFAANAMDFLAGSQDLVSIRGKGTSLRPFDVVRRMEVEAQQRYREKLTDLEARLQKVQTQLTELQGKQSEGNRLIASPEVTKAIEDYQQQSAALRSERRQIRRALREDIDALENGLLITNLVASPLLVAAFGIWFYRARRR
jgi:ABC-type uncharacterized transport system involved in gliding motility auxiliary subunit